MTYWALNAVFLAIVAVVALAGILSHRAPRWRAVALTAALLLVTTAVFDNVMIGVGLVGYDPAKITGAKLGIAPLEDFAYAIAVVVLLPALWHLLPSRRRPAPVDQGIRAETPAERDQTPAERRRGEGSSR